MTDDEYIKARKVLSSPRRDMRAYIEHLRRAANAGHPQALENLGSWHLEGLRDSRGWIVKKNTARAIELLQRAGSLGDGIALFTLGNCFDEGTGVARDRTMARKYFLAAYRLGVPLGALNLSLLCHEVGDERGELRWLRRAADAGESEAVISLGYRAIRKRWRRATFGKLVPSLRKLAKQNNGPDAQEANDVLRAAKEAGLL